MKSRTDRAGVDRAQKAVAQFRTMQSGLTSYARAVTGDRNLRIEPASATHTDGSTIYFAVPMRLADDIKHDRGSCDKRDPVTLEQVCPACSLREEILVSIYHEIAHIAYHSFDKFTDTDRKRALAYGVQLKGDAYSAHMRAKLDALGRAELGRSFMALATSISEYLPLLVNILEDVRIDQRMYEARKGIRRMRESRMRRVIATGIENADGTMRVWREQPLNSQLIAGLYAASAGFELEGNFAPEVIEALGTPDILDTAVAARTARSASDVFNLAFNTLVAAKKLGFFHEEDDPQPQPEPEDQTSEEKQDRTESGPDNEPDDSEQSSEEDEGQDEEQQDEDSDTESDQDSGGEDEQPSGEGSGDDTDGESSGEGTAPEDGESDSGDQSSEDDSDSEDAPEGGDSVPADTEDVEDGAEPDSESGAEGSGAQSAPDSDDAEPGGAGAPDADADADGASGNDGTGEEAGGEESDGDPGDVESGSVGESGDTSDGRADAASASGEVEHEAPDDGRDDPQDGDDAGDDDSDRESDDVESDPSTDGGEGGDQSDISADEHGESDPSDEAGDSSDIPGDHDPEPTEGDDGGGVAPPEEDSEPEPASKDGDSEAVGTDEWDENAIEQDPSPEYGTAADIPDIIEAVTGHHGDHKSESVGSDDSSEIAAIKAALLQGTYFEKAPINVVGVNVRRYDQPDRGYEDAWRGSNGGRAPRYDENSYVMLGMRADLEIPESVMGPALLLTRRAFEDNARAKHQRNMKSGKIRGGSLAKRAPLGDPRLFKKTVLPGKKDYSVLIGIDISGSTAGENIVLAKRAAMAQAQLCARVGIDFAVYAHTADSQPGGLTLEMYEIKAFGEQWNSKAQEALQNIGAFAYNIDGHTMEFYRRTIERQPSTDKIILYYTDGKMPAANSKEELVVMKEQIRKCQQQGVALMGVGIRTDSPKRHGLDTVRVDTDADLSKVITHLEKKLVNR